MRDGPELIAAMQLWWRHLASRSQRVPGLPQVEQPAWSVLSSAAGLTTAGDGMAMLHLRVPADTPPMALRCETWGKNDRLDVRDVSPVAVMPDEWILVALYADITPGAIQYWRLVVPDVPPLYVMTEHPEAGQRTRGRRVLGRRLLVPGDPQRLVVRAGRVLHHRECGMLRWCDDAVLRPVAEMATLLRQGAVVCHSCIPH